MTFLGFVKMLRVKLTPAQRVLCAVAFDGAEPRDLVGAEREIARKLFGDIETIPAIARAVVALVAGRGGGKTYVAALRLLHLAVTANLTQLAPGELAYCVIVAPDLRLARQALRFALGAVRACPQLKPMLENPTADSFVLRRPDGRSVTLECLPATRGGSAVRGRSLVGFLCDEIAFFRDSDSVINDADIFRAAAPRVMAGGQLIVSSTPWAEAGLLYELHRDQFGAPKSALVVHAPTVLLRPSERARVDAEYQRDPVNAERELGAEFFSAGTGQFFDGQAVDDARDEGRTDPLPPTIHRCIAAIDLAFSADSSALAIVRDEGPRVVLVDWLERKPRKGKPLKPSEVIAEFAARARAHGCSEIWGDQHYAETAREHLNAARMGFLTTPGGATGKEQTYRRAQRALAERRVSLPDFPRLLQQFRDVLAKPLPGGSIQISHPRRAGQGHGDLCAASVVAIAQAVGAGRSEGLASAPPRRIDPASAYAQFSNRPAQGRGIDSIGLAPDGTSLRIGAAHVMQSRSAFRGKGGF